jgi:DNA-binding HxlR family transcriptional regulator
MAQAQGAAHGEEVPAREGLDLALVKVGDRWTLLLVNALLDGPRRFKDLAGSVPGLAPNILTSRLRRLEREGLVVAALYSRRPPRYEYRLSDEGRQLAGTLRLLTHWGTLSSGGQAEGPWHRSCGTPLEARWYCPTCGRVAERADDDLEWL